MKDGDKLPRELVWDGAHVSELGLTALADGQESIVTRDAIEHAGNDAFKRGAWEEGAADIFRER